MKKLYIIIISLVIAVVGVVGFVYFNTADQRALDKWVVLENPSSTKDVTKVSGKAKFMEDNGGQYLVGYIIDATVNKLDNSKVPDKNNKETKKEDSAIAPLDESLYSCNIMLTLRDKDGFELARLNGPEHPIKSGIANTFQNKSIKSVSKEIALKTKSIKQELIVLKWEPIKN